MGGSGPASCSGRRRRSTRRFPHSIKGAGQGRAAAKPHHSILSAATTGSMRLARRAGANDASRATTVRTRATAAYVNGSVVASCYTPSRRYYAPHCIAAPGSDAWTAYDPEELPTAKVTPEFKSHFPLDMSLRPSQIRASAEETALMTSAATKFQNRYSSLNLPVFIIAGAGDRIVNPHIQSRRLARDIPGSTLLFLRGLGHMLHHSAPDEVMGALDTISHRISDVGRLAA